MEKYFNLFCFVSTVMTNLSRITNENSYNYKTQNHVFNNIIIKYTY